VAIWETVDSWDIEEFNWDIEKPLLVELKP
jgi:hypothetical protein